MKVSLNISYTTYFYKINNQIFFKYYQSPILRFLMIKLKMYLKNKEHWIKEIIKIIAETSTAVLLCQKYNQHAKAKM